MDMVDDADRKGNENETPSGSTAAEASPGATPAAVEDKPPDQPESHLSPFAKPYNEYFKAVQEAYRSLHDKAVETYTAYVKAAQDAVQARDAEALRSATEKYNTTLAELANPGPLSQSVSNAFDIYHKEMMAAFSSGATGILGPGCIAVVAYSMAVVASHRMAYQRGLRGL
jgi:hypothetical protein